MIAKSMTRSFSESGSSATLLFSTRRGQIEITSTIKEVIVYQSNGRQKAYLTLMSFLKAPLFFDRRETTVEENDESWKLLWHNVAENGGAVQWDCAIVR